MNQIQINNAAYINLTARESYNFLSNNLLFKKNESKAIVIAVNSFMPGEGKTTVAINLAISAAISGAKTLLVDADLRQTYKQNNKQKEKGLGDYNHELNTSTFINSTSVRNLSFVSSGMELVDPIEFLNSSIYSDFITRMSDQYDVIIIDTPASGKYVDGAIIASRATGSLIVTCADKSRYKSIERLKWQMEHAQANILGVLINKVRKNEYKSYYVMK